MATKRNQSEDRIVKRLRSDEPDIICLDDEPDIICLDDEPAICLDYNSKDECDVKLIDDYCFEFENPCYDDFNGNVPEIKISTLTDAEVLDLSRLFREIDISEILKKNSTNTFFKTFLFDFLKYKFEEIDKNEEEEIDSIFNHCIVCRSWLIDQFTFLISQLVKFNYGDIESQPHHKEDEEEIVHLKRYERELDIDEFKFSKDFEKAKATNWYNQVFEKNEELKKLFNFVQCLAKPFDNITNEYYEEDVLFTEESFIEILDSTAPSISIDKIGQKEYESFIAHKEYCKKKHDKLSQLFDIHSNNLIL